MIGDSDRELHYSDGSHRWVCPDPDGDGEAWCDRVRAHVAHHSDPEVFGRGETPVRQPPPPAKGYG
jgi:hypothetical protein